MIDDLTVIVPFWNGNQYLPRLLDSLPDGLPVIVVDDHGDESPQAQGATVIRPKHRGYFTGAVNAGLEACETDVLILNQDVWFTDDRWQNVIAENRGQCAVFGEGITGNHPAWPKGYVHGTFMFIRRDCIAAVGRMNADDYPLWGSTCEYQLRACRRGFSARPLAKIPGMEHEDRRRFGPAITEALRREPERKREFIRTPPMVSVIVPCYNYGNYLPEAIASLIGGHTCLGDVPGQTFQSFEVIIVDDASTDNSAEVAMSLSDSWKGIHAICLDKNVGTADCINAGIEQARGQYITILSADDMLQPHHLETLLRICQNNPHRVAFGDILRLFGRNDKKVLRLPEYDFCKLAHKNGMSAGIMYPRAAWKEVGGYPSIMRDGREDWAFNVALGAKGWYGIRYPGEPGYIHRVMGHNRTLTNRGRWQEFYEKIKGLFPEVYSMACCGGRGRTGRSAASTKQGGNMKRQASAPGSEGMTLIEYTGPSHLKQTWWGSGGRRYEFGRSHPVGYVDNRDLPTFMQFKENGQPIFRKYQKPQALAPVAPEPATVEVPDLDMESENEIDLADVEYDATSGAAAMAEEHGLDLGEITGTGKDGRITKQDVQRVIESQHF